MKNKDKKLIVIVTIIWMLLFVILGVYQSHEQRDETIRNRESKIRNRVGKS